MISLTQKELKNQLLYEEGTGIFKRIRTRKVAGSKDSKGYTQIKVNGKLFFAHRLAWLYVHGHWPDGHIDHVDRDPQNNSIGNLRVCTHAQNHQNTGRRADNTSGHTGVSFIKNSGKWLAYINTNGIRHRVGLFIAKEDAVAARECAKKTFHKFSAR